MSLIKLVKRLSNTEKTKILGEETTRILRFTFTSKDTDAIPTDIIDMAVTIKDGVNLVNKANYREQLIESLSFSKIKSLGFASYEEAITTYKKDIKRFFIDFDIEDQYKKQVVVDDRNNTETLIPIFGECNGKNAFPHFYQLDLKDKVNKSIFNTQDKSILVTMPTGAGKTVLAMEVIIDLFRNYRVEDNDNLKIGWFVDSTELSEQSLQSFQKLWKQKGDRNVVAQRYFGKFNTLDSRDSNMITFGAFSLLTERMNDSDVTIFLKGLDFIVIDEAHGANALTYNRVIEKYKNLNDYGKILGLTATPFRNDDDEYNSLKGLFQTYLEITDGKNKSLRSPMEFLIERGYLAEINYQIMNAEKGNSRSEYYNDLHDSVKKECNRLLEKGENTIIFAESKSHAIALNLYLTSNDIENKIIIGETPNEHRKDYLKRFGDKKDSLSVIVNHQILSTGIDVPGMNSIMILANINSPTLALQIVGRAMRGEKNGGNVNNTIFLTKDNYNKLKEYKLLESIVLGK